jgi:hypothetical protein
MTTRSRRPALASLLAALVLAGPAHAQGGSFVFDGGTQRQQAQVRAALEASSFDWSVVTVRITIHIRRLPSSYATPGHVWLAAGLLDAGRFAWAVVQDEYAHQVDYFLLDDAARQRLTGALGARDWCYGVQGLAHHEYGCERFTSTLVWTYWQSKDNAYRPRSSSDESAAMAPAAFRTLLAELIGAHGR